MPIVNFSGVEDFPAPMPTGVYPVVVSEVEERESQTSEYPYYRLTLIVTDGDYSGRKLFTNISLSPKAAFKLKEALLAFGETDADLANDFDLDMDRYLDVDCLATVGTQTYNGNLSNVVNSLKSKMTKTAPLEAPGTPGTSAKPKKQTFR